MMKNIVETVTGALVLVVAFGFVIFAYKGGDVKPAMVGYKLTARFEKADGIEIGTDVRIGGIKVGKVISQALDPASYLAVISFSLSKEIQIPKDSSVQIVSDGLLGGKYMSIVPGADEQMLKEGGEIKFTQSSVNLETLIGKMIFSNADKNNAKPAN